MRPDLLADLARRFGWTEDVVRAVAEALEPRYAGSVPLGAGGSSEVVRVEDRDLQRTVAAKVLRSDDPAEVARFVAEARATARLQHPAVVPVYDLGTWPDGRAYFTMAEVQGRTFHDAVRDLHASLARGRPATPDGWTLFRLVAAFEQVCAAVSYAHDRGVVHRDLKPANLMIGRFGEVRVLDWGLAASDGDPAGDVFALGSVLYAVLTGRTRWAGEAEPRALMEVVRAAWAPDPVDRPSADGLAVLVRAWLDGTTRRAVAQRWVDAAAGRQGDADDLRVRASGRDADADALLAGVDPWDPEERKVDGWAARDDAAGLRAEADRAELEADGLLRTALLHDPELLQAHRALAARARAAIERGPDAPAEVQLRACVAALPEAERRPILEWLDGDGAVTLRTDPPGATVQALRFEEVRRRLVLVDRGPIGVTPLVRRALGQGSWVLRIRAPGRVEVDYPVAIGRGEHWDGVPPGSTDALPIVLPPMGSLGDDDRYVPAGWFLAGGDEAEGDPLPAARRWCDALVVRRFPVTNQEYLAFLDADPAHEAFVPRDRSDTLGAAGPPLVRRGPDGFELCADQEGDVWQPDWPVLMVDLRAAAAYARWRSAVDGVPWRLPDELEWEKAARGVDGRAFPWGRWLDPTWARHLRSVPGRKMPVSVDEYPVDCSVYGVRCCAGTVQEWTSTRYRTEGPPGPRVVPEPLVDPIPLDPDALRTVRGGHWYGPPALCRCACRLATEPANRAFHLGFRLVRSYGQETSPRRERVDPSTE